MKITGWLVSTAVVVACFQTAVQGFSVTTPQSAMGTLSSSSTCLSMAAGRGSGGGGGDKDADFMRWAKASRSAQDGDTIVELQRPLGLILQEDEYRNVYVETVAPRGNAARTGKVRIQDFYWSQLVLKTGLICDLQCIYNCFLDITVTLYQTGQGR